MKKSLVLLSLLLNLIVFSQLSTYSKINDINILKKEYKNVSASQKGEYFFRYLKLKEVQQLKNDPQFAKFSDDILLQLVDEIYPGEEFEESPAVDDVARYNTVLSKVMEKSISSEDLDYEDLLYLYNPNGIYSGLQINEISANKNNIYFSKGTGAGGGNYDYTYKVKKNKLQLINTRNH